MPKRVAEAAMKARLAVIEAARDEGRDHYRRNPDELLITIARVASMAYGTDVNAQIGFLQGYSEARMQHDGYKRGE